MSEENSNEQKSEEKQLEKWGELTIHEEIKTTLPPEMFTILKNITTMIKPILQKTSKLLSPDIDKYNTQDFMIDETGRLTILMIKEEKNIKIIISREEINKILGVLLK